ncbi:MAG: response regulator [Bacteroidota bacterium]|nr:response regulator [Bacteroidota bacterium]MDP4230973.1 response regulator [Bacteroidota bacterium]MDP4235279.1 response regulator [Bacteroidota bacterium]
MNKRKVKYAVQKTLMIVEDFDFIRSLVGKHFQTDGYDIISAGNMQEAMNLGQQEQPNVVIVDFDMTSNDPYLIISILHNILPMSQIVLMNGRSRHCDTDEAKTAGVDKILDRTYDPVVLEEVAHSDAYMAH